MARIEHIKRRLANWALWKVRGDSGGLGFATRSSFLRDTWSESTYNGALVPVLELEAEETDQAVESLRDTREQIYWSLQAIYIDGVGIKEAARRLCKAESTVKAHLEQGDQAIADWLAVQAEQRQRKRDGVNVVKKSFPT